MALKTLDSALRRPVQAYTLPTGDTDSRNFAATITPGGTLDFEGAAGFFSLQLALSSDFRRDPDAAVRLWQPTFVSGEPFRESSPPYLTANGGTQHWLPTIASADRALCGTPTHRDRVCDVAHIIEYDNRLLPDSSVLCPVPLSNSGGVIFRDLSIGSARYTMGVSQRDAYFVTGNQTKLQRESGDLFWPYDDGSLAVSLPSWFRERAQQGLGYVGEGSRLKYWEGFLRHHSDGTDEDIPGTIDYATGSRAFRTYSALLNSPDTEPKYAGLSLESDLDCRSLYSTLDGVRYRARYGAITARRALLDKGKPFYRLDTNLFQGFPAVPLADHPTAFHIPAKCRVAYVSEGRDALCSPGRWGTAISEFDSQFLRHATTFGEYTRDSMDIIRHSHLQYSFGGNNSHDWIACATCGSPTIALPGSISAVPFSDNDDDMSAGWKGSPSERRARRVGQGSIKWTLAMPGVEYKRGATLVAVEPNKAGSSSLSREKLARFLCHSLEQSALLFSTANIKLRRENCFYKCSGCDPTHLTTGCDQGCLSTCGNCGHFVAVLEEREESVGRFSTDRPSALSYCNDPLFHLPILQGNTLRWIGETIRLPARLTTCSTTPTFYSVAQVGHRTRLFRVRCREQNRDTCTTCCLVGSARDGGDTHARQYEKHVHEGTGRPGEAPGDKKFQGLEFTVSAECLCQESITAAASSCGLSLTATDLDSDFQPDPTTSKTNAEERTRRASTAGSAKGYRNSKVPNRFCERSLKKLYDISSVQERLTEAEWETFHLSLPRGEIASEGVYSKPGSGTEVRLSWFLPDGLFKVVSSSHDECRRSEGEWGGVLASRRAASENERCLKLSNPQTADEEEGTTFDGVSGIDCPDTDPGSVRTVNAALRGQSLSSFLPEPPAACEPGSPGSGGVDMDFKVGRPSAGLTCFSSDQKENGFPRPVYNLGRFGSRVDRPRSKRGFGKLLSVRPVRDQFTIAGLAFCSLLVLVFAAAPVVSQSDVDPPMHNVTIECPVCSPFDLALNDLVQYAAPALTIVAVIFAMLAQIFKKCKSDDPKVQQAYDRLAKGFAVSAGVAKKSSKAAKQVAAGVSVGQMRLNPTQLVKLADRMEDRMISCVDLPFEVQYATDPEGASMERLVPTDHATWVFSRLDHSSYIEGERGTSKLISLASNTDGLPFIMVHKNHCFYYPLFPRDVFKRVAVLFDILEACGYIRIPTSGANIEDLSLLPMVIKLKRQENNLPFEVLRILNMVIPVSSREAVHSVSLLSLWAAVCDFIPHDD